MLCLRFAPGAPEDGLDILLFQVHHKAARHIDAAGVRLGPVRDILVVDGGKHGERQLTALRRTAHHKAGLPGATGKGMVLRDWCVVRDKLTAGLRRGLGGSGGQPPRPHPDDKGGAGGQSPVPHPRGAGAALWRLQIQQFFVDRRGKLLPVHIGFVLFHGNSPCCIIFRFCTQGPLAKGGWHGRDWGIPFSENLSL